MLMIIKFNQTKLEYSSKKKIVRKSIVFNKDI